MGWNIVNEIKHYYAESERITSLIGRGNFSTLATPVTDTATANRKVRLADSLVLALNPAITDTVAQLSYLTTLTNRQKDTCEAYWYHPDHLGSSSWITFSDGKAVEHLHYMPWGEDFVRQRSTDWHAMYTFSAKEKDAETGYSYFGSRYYNSDLSIWLSVDPMADKYPSMSSYVYCANNPVKLVDPNGEDWYENENGQILWDDNVTKDSKLSPGCTYIGAEDNDIVNHYGFQSHQTQTTTTYGMICMGEEGYHWTKATTKTDLYVKAEVSNDGSGKVFKGISISASTLTSSPGSTEGPMELRGGLEVKYCGETFKDGLKEDNMPHYLASGTEYKQASINISAAQLIKSRSYIQPIQSISVKGGYSVTGFDQQYRPLVLHGLLPYPRRLKQNF